MAREEVSGKVGETKKPNALKIGEVIEGYYIRSEDSVQFPGNLSLIMKGKDGSLFRVSSHGNIKFALRDGSLTPGSYTWITALGPTVVKGKPSTKYKIEQDNEITTSVPAATSSFDAIESANNVTAAVERTSAAALKADKVRQAMGR